MFKLLIVEDEKWEREGLKDFLDWNSLGIQLSGLACDGIEGLEKARELSPDIIITDIKMPGMDGLKMSRGIKEFLPNVKIIILTGYDDFKLARDAINISANAYILKPVEEEEMLGVLNRALDDCRKEANKAEEDKKLKELLDENKLTVKKELLTGILREKASFEAKMQVYQFGILPDCRQYAVITAGINLPEADGGPEISGAAGAFFDASSFDTAGLAAESGLSLTMHQSDGIVYIIAAGESLTGSILEQVTGVFVEGASNRSLNAVAGIGAIVGSLEELYFSCQQAREALNSALFWGDRSTVTFKALESLQQEKAAKVGDFLVKGNFFTKQILHSLRATDETRLTALLDEMFQLIEESKWADRNMIVNFLYGLLNETSLLFYNTNLSELEDGTAGTLMLGLRDFRSIRGFVMGFFEKALGIISDKKNNKDEYIVKKVEQIVMERYMSDISLKTIAAEIYLSPNYLGSTFKKCMGIPFNDYLCQFRMEKAKELLQSPKYKVSRVAREVGIPNVSYFCLLFKDMFGIAPGEYQNMNK